MHDRITEREQTIQDVMEKYQPNAWYDEDKWYRKFTAALAVERTDAGTIISLGFVTDEDLDMLYKRFNLFPEHAARLVAKEYERRMMAHILAQEAENEGV